MTVNNSDQTAVHLKCFASFFMLQMHCLQNGGMKITMRYIVHKELLSKLRFSVSFEPYC